MKKYLVLAAAVAAISAPAFAEETAAPAATEAAAPAAEAAPAATEEVAVEVVEKKLADGTVIHIKAEEVFVVGADGAETPAPDGDHTLEDGTVVKTLGGKVVAE